MHTNTSLGYFEDLLILFPVSVALTAYHVRDLLETAAPKGIETPIPKENHADYGLGPNRREVFAYLCPMENHVRLGFYYGDALPDPSGLLMPEGKHTRYAKLHSLAEAKQPEIRALIQAAVTERINALAAI